MRTASVLACLLLQVAAAWAGPRVATATPADPAAPAAAPASVTAQAPEPAQAQQGLAIGAELGEPISATVGFFTGKLALAGAVGTGTFEGVGIQVHGDVQLEVTRLKPDMPLRVGLGARFYHHGYQPASTDELPDSHFGLRVPVAIAMERGAMQLYAEAAPGIDIAQSRSCSLADGAFSVCPHAQQSPFFLQLVIGARWFLSH